MVLKKRPDRMNWERCNELELTEKKGFFIVEGRMQSRKDHLSSLRLQVPFPMRRLLLSLLVAVTLTGCDALGGDDAPPKLNGPYEITTQDGSAELTFDLDLSESKNEISGSGLFVVENPDTPEAATSDIEVSGTHDHPDVQIDMELTDLDVPDVSFDGSLNGGGDKAEGTMTFPDGDQQDVVLRAE